MLSLCGKEKCSIYIYLKMYISTFKVYERRAADKKKTFFHRCFRQQPKRRNNKHIKSKRRGEKGEAVDSFTLCASVQTATEASACSPRGVNDFARRRETDKTRKKETSIFFLGFAISHVCSNFIFMDLRLVY